MPALVAKAKKKVSDSKMKRYGNLFEKIISIENLMLANKRARAGKDSKSMRKFDDDVEGNILRLHESLKNKTFKTSNYRYFKIYEPKERNIASLPYYPDRIVHHAIINVMDEIWTPMFVADTFSCIKGRGINGRNGARRHVERIIRKHKDDENLYCLYMDIHHFYPSIDHNILLGILGRKIKDSDLMWLIGEIVNSCDGIPIGNYTSQYFANLYLTQFDHFVKEELKVDYARYCDNMIFVSGSKDELHNVRRCSEKYLNRLKLSINGDWQVFKIGENKYFGRGINFVGYVFYRNCILIRKSIKKMFARRCNILDAKNTGVRQYKIDISSWIGWSKFANCVNMKRKFLKEKYFELC